MEKIKITEDINGMFKIGYITKTQLENDSEAQEVIYGVFKNIDDATKWAQHLINAQVIPVYMPQFNRG